MRLLHKGLCWTACAVFSFTLTLSAQDGKPAASSGQNSASIAATDQAQPAQKDESATELPDSPGVVEVQNTNPQQGNQPSIVPQTGSAQAAPPPAEQQAKPQRPVGTAAAEAPMVSGVSAAQPAGVAIAPAKQRRVRTLVIKVGALIGAGVALGTTVALTRGTPSKPPGAH